MKQVILIFFSLLSATAFSMSTQEAQVMAEKLLMNTSVDSVRHYCTSGGMTCRSIYTYRNKKTNAPVPLFRITFFSSERQVAGTELYVQIGYSSRFYRFVDETFDGKINISKSDEVQVVKRSGNDFTIKDLYLPKLGTTEYILSDLVFKDDISYLEGVLKDSQNPATQKPIRIDYLRINP